MATNKEHALLSDFPDFNIPTPPLSEAGKKFLKTALTGSPQVPDNKVVEGKVQDGEFD